jgi:hypothetical protein
VIARTPRIKAGAYTGSGTPEVVTGALVAIGTAPSTVTVDVTNGVSWGVTITRQSDTVVACSVAWSMSLSGLVAGDFTGGQAFSGTASFATGETEKLIPFSMGGQNGEDGVATFTLEAPTNCTVVGATNKIIAVQRVASTTTPPSSTGYDILVDRPDIAPISGKTARTASTLAELSTLLTQFTNGTYDRTTNYIKLSGGFAATTVTVSVSGTSGAPVIIYAERSANTNFSNRAAIGTLTITGSWIWVDGVDFTGSGLRVTKNGDSKVLITRCRFAANSAGIKNNGYKTKYVWVGYCTFSTVGTYTDSNKVNINPVGGQYTIANQPGFWVFYNCDFYTNGTANVGDHEPTELYIGAEVGKNLFTPEGSNTVTGANVFLPIWVENCRFNTNRTHGWYSKCGGRFYNVLTTTDGTHGFRHGGFLLHERASPRMWACSDLDGNLQLYTYHGGTATWGISDYQTPQQYRVDIRGCTFTSSTTIQAGCLQEGGTNGNPVAQNWAAGARVYGCTGGNWELGWARDGWPVRAPLRDFEVRGHTGGTFTTPSFSGYTTSQLKDSLTVLTGLAADATVVPTYSALTDSSVGAGATAAATTIPARWAALGLDV